MTSQEPATRGRRAHSVRVAALAGSVAALILASLIGVTLAFTAKEACRAGAWNVGVEQYQAHCYTDIYPLYFTEGLASGQVPYFDHHVEYPVVMGAAMQAAAWIVRPVTDAGLRGREFFDVTVAILGLFLVAGVLATASCAGRSRRWTALLVALSPALILGALINWDLIAMALTMLALAAWAARRPGGAGLLLGLAVATKFYPVICLLPLFGLCLRAGRLRQFWTTTGFALASWLAVNLPVAIAAPSGWATFYVFNARRGADWGSVWYFFQAEHWPWLGGLSLPTINLASALIFLAACAGVLGLALMAPRRPRLPQLILLATAAFLLTNKVWSPQYVVWLVPLVVLARPRLGGYLLWQIAEVGYFFAIWGYLIFIIAGAGTSGSVGPGLYFTALLARFGAVLVLCALVVRDILRPDLDVVRASGEEDDPAGGVLDGVGDRLVLALRHTG
ncbi:MAG TPA: glycosyltransferase 87 family protein [Streptosporangiaceae bacterium]